MDLSSSSDEEDPSPDTSHDFEFAQRLDGDGKIIILSDSDEEEEACEETATDTNVAPSIAVVKPSTPTASPVDIDEDPMAMLNDSSDGLAPGSKMGKDSGGGDEAGVP
jgi:hypothetical protein